MLSAARGLCRRAAFLHLTVQQFAAVNIVAHPGLARRRAALIGIRSRTLPRIATRRLAGAAAAACVILAAATPASAQDDARRAARRASTPTRRRALHPYAADAARGRDSSGSTSCSFTHTAGLPVRRQRVRRRRSRGRPRLSRAHSATRGRIDAHAAWSMQKLQGGRRAALRLPAFATAACGSRLRGDWLDAPDVAFYGVGNRFAPTSSAPASPTARRRSALRHGVQARRHVAVGGGFDVMDVRAQRDRESSHPTVDARPTAAAASSPSSTRARRRGYTRRGGLYRASTGPTIARPTPGRLQLPPRRRRGAAVRAAPARELGHRAARARLDDVDRRRATTCRTS